MEWLAIANGIGNANSVVQRIPTKLRFHALDFAPIALLQIWQPTIRNCGNAKGHITTFGDPAVCALSLK